MHDIFNAQYTDINANLENKMSVQRQTDRHSPDSLQQNGDYPSQISAVSNDTSCAMTCWSNTIIADLVFTLINTVAKQLKKIFTKFWIPAMIIPKIF